MEKEDLASKFLISISTAFIVALINRAVSRVSWLWVSLAFVVIFVFLWVYPGLRDRFKPSKQPGRVDAGREKGKNTLLLGCFALLSIAMWDQVIGPMQSDRLIADAEVNLLIGSHRWITYDPLHFDPSLYPNPNVDAMDRELKWIRDAGFDGIITFASRGAFSMIPELAKRNGLFVIVGVWDPTDRQEITAAISKQEYTDAYCVGHNGLGKRYSYDELVKTIQYIRFRTKCPVSTTEKIGLYLSDPRLLSIGDWIFPDAHVSVQNDGDMNFLADATRDAEKTVGMAKIIAEHERRNTKPILLKMVTYPMHGITNASLEEQAAFFVSILEGRRNVLPDMPSDVSISVHSAFDTSWKKAWPFYEWDPHTGLLDDKGSPRPAAVETVRRLP
jgi:exo-beta-1,3-glucanase (GH17 family)